MKPTKAIIMKRITSLLVAMVVLPATLASTGCVAAIGNRDAQRGHGTLGQQLIDLKKAHDFGAMSESEYQKEKARLLK